MSDRDCVICDKGLGDGTPTVVVKKGLSSLAEVSRKRKDGKVLLFERSSSVQVHVKCRKSYTNERMITAHLKRVKEVESSRSCRSSTPTFNFKSQCFLCGIEIPENYEVSQRKIAVHKRNPVYLVKSVDMKDKVLELAKRCNDEYCQGIVHRVGSSFDIKAAGGQYHLDCMKDLHNRCWAPSQEPRKRGRPSDTTEVCVDQICSYLENNDEECQFTPDELMQQVQCDDPPIWKTVRNHLIQRYGEDILITDKKPSIVCFKHTGHKILTDAWYEKKSPSVEEERRRIVETAAAIILEDIRSQVYNVTEYPPPHDFMQGAEELIPESLRAFTDALVLSKKRGDLTRWRKKSTAIAHALIAAVRPASFVSPLLVGVSALLYKKFGSRRLIEVLSTLGFCSSYTEATRCEISAIMRPPLAVQNESVSQMVFDNADFNVHTLDGHNTFHVMGGIVCVTPKSSIVPGQVFPRIMNIPSAEEIEKLGVIPLQPFHNLDKAGLAAVPIKDVGENLTHAEIIIPTIPDLVWLYSKSKELPGTGGWNGFMEEVTKGMPFKTTYVGIQPFIRAPPSDYDTVYTSLMFGIEKTRSLGQETAIVTFDQPLYLKAREIIASCPEEMRNVVVRLGGFHLLMSFMGTIGYIMQGSGLTELFNTVYAVNSTEKIMTGHSYERAIRAHYLAHRAIAHIIFQTDTFSIELHATIQELLYGGGREVIRAESTCDRLKELNNFADQLQQLASRGPTAKLWIQYFETVTLIKQFIEAERRGDWDLHLQTIFNMLPYFHASGHYLYAKCAHLYLQDMLVLGETMPKDEYVHFTSGGYFTVRRTDKVWCGTFTDQTIEQNLMKNMKTQGGLTRSRALSASVATRWTQGLTSMSQITEAVETYCGVNFGSSEQHVDAREARVKRDNKDACTMLAWLETHPPFPETEQLISISTGIVGDERINCHISRELGTQGMTRIIGGDFKTVKFKRNDRVKPLATMNSSIHVHDKVVIVNPTTLFQRMTIAKESEEELQEFLTYELSPYPMSLFNEGGMRKGTKSSLYKCFKSVPDTTVSGEIVHVIDGGFLLHRVVWPPGQTFSNICDTYINYIRCHYTSASVIVFDGYCEPSTSTKNVERSRRAAKRHSVELVFTEDMSPKVSQEHFLANERNKSRMISLLRIKLNAAQIVSYQAEEDADRLIVTTAISLSSDHNTVAVVGEDVDLLVLLIGLVAPTNVYFLKPGRGRALSTWFHPKTALNERLSQHILFLHAVSGCDTTSALFSQGKAKTLKTLDKNPDLSLPLLSFKKLHKDIDVETIFTAGEKFIAALYGGNMQVPLDELRYKCYKSAAYKSSSNMATLPPTRAAAHQHFLRVYVQVQLWMGQPISWGEPEKFGWRHTSNGLQPITSNQPPAPNKLLQLVACKCKKGCSTAKCGCKKAGLYCSNMCEPCEAYCSNVQRYDLEEEEDLDDKHQPPVQDVPEVETQPDDKHQPPVHDVQEVEPQPGPSGMQCSSVPKRGRTRPC